MNQNVKIVSLFGSPDKNGTSSNLHRAFLENFEESSIKKYYSYAMDVNPCNACMNCRENGYCPYIDDASAFFKDFYSADLLSLSWPVYFSSMPGPMKCIIDRFQKFWIEKQLGQYKGSCKSLVYFISAGDCYESVFEPSYKIIKYLSNSFNLEIKEDYSAALSGMDNETNQKKIDSTINKLKKLK